MKLAKMYKKGKYHMISDVWNWGSKCGRNFSKSDVKDFDRDEFFQLAKQRVICEQCYNRYLGK